MKKRILAAAVMLFVLTTQFAFAAIEKEYTFTTTDADYAKKTVADLGKGEMKDIPKQIKAGWLKVSEASGITYTLKIKVEPEEVVYENLLEKNLPKDAEQIEKDGKTLKLADTDWESEKRSALTGTLTKKGYDEKPDFPATKELSVVLDNGAEIKTTGKLKSVSASGQSYSKNFSVTGKFIGDPDVSYYDLNGTLIPNNPETPLFKGYESIILKHFGMNPSRYRITSGKWTSDYIEEDGQTVRYAKFSGQRKASDWTAYYEEELKDNSPSPEIYTATCKYGSKETVYTVTAKVSYAKSRFTVLGLIAVGSAAVIIIAAFIILILALLKKNGGKKDEGTENW